MTQCKADYVKCTSLVLEGPIQYVVCSQGFVTVRALLSSGSNLDNQQMPSSMVIFQKSFQHMGSKVLSYHPNSQAGGSMSTSSKIFEPRCRSSIVPSVTFTKAFCSHGSQHCSQWETGAGRTRCDESEVSSSSFQTWRNASFTEELFSSTSSSNHLG